MYEKIFKYFKKKSISKEYYIGRYPFKIKIYAIFTKI